MSNDSAYFINCINPSSFKTLSKLPKYIRKNIVLIGLILLWVNDAGAQVLSWSKTLRNYANVTAQFNINNTPSGLKTINQTVITWSLAIFKKRTKHVVIASEVKQPSTEF